MAKTDKVKNSFWVRIYDDELLKSIFELFGTGRYSSMNELMTKALEIGINQLYSVYGKKKALDVKVGNDINDVTLDLKEIIKNTRIMTKKIDEVFVMLNIIEILDTTTFNAFRSIVAGEKVTPEQLDSGYYSMLPDNIAEVKNELIQEANKRDKKGV